MEFIKLVSNDRELYISVSEVAVINLEDDKVGIIDKSGREYSANKYLSVTQVSKIGGRQCKGDIPLNTKARTTKVRVE